MSSPSRFAAAALVAAGLLAPLAAEAAGTRTHVSNAGSDANTAFSCDYAHPCRTFAAALTQTNPGGEILAIDSSGYGKVVIDRSVSIIAAPGVFAGIGVGAGGNATGVQIATPGVRVVLRGLTVTGQGGDYGIYMSDGESLSVENCVFSNFPLIGQFGLAVSGPATVSVIDTLFRDNYNGIYLAYGATGSVAGSRIFGGVNGIKAYTSNAGATTAVSISGTTVSGATAGIAAQAVTHAAATTRITLSNSVVTNNNTGISLFASNGATAVFETLGNNTVRQNVTNSSGTITPVTQL